MYNVHGMMVPVLHKHSPCGEQLASFAYMGTYKSNLSHRHPVRNKRVCKATLDCHLGNPSNQIKLIYKRKDETNSRFSALTAH